MKENEPDHLAKIDLVNYIQLYEEFDHYNGLLHELQNKCEQNFKAKIC